MSVVDVSARLPETDASSAAADQAALLLDVRDYHEWMSGHAPAAVLAPMEQLPSRLAELPTDRRILCICRSGNRSGRVVAWLRSQGYDAVNVSGGMRAWAAAGLPLENHNGRPGTVV